MKLTIKHEKDDEGPYWRCELLHEEAMWLGLGDSPIEAFEDYLDLVVDKDEPNKGHFDYDWCQEKGLIK